MSKWPSSLKRASACVPLQATWAVWFPVGGNERRQPTVVCTATVEKCGIFPVNSHSGFDVLPTTRALKFVLLLFLSECSPVLINFSQIRQTSDCDITDWYERSHLDVVKRTLPGNLFEAPADSHFYMKHLNTRPIFFLGWSRNCTSGLWTSPGR